MSPLDTIGYRRVSSREQATVWKTSLEDQTKAITALAERLGRVLLPEAIYQDLFSGEDAEDRAGFMALVEYCRSNPRPRRSPGYALFLNDSRFGRFRDPDENGFWRYHLSTYGWVVRYVENDDTQDPTTRHVMRSVGGAQASQYLANLRANAKRGTRGAAQQGLWQNEAPFGYRRLATSSNRDPVVLEAGQRKADDQQVRLTPGPDDEVGLLVWMFETYADGLESLNGLARAMRRLAPKLKWSKQHVSKVLSNRAYVGDVVWCRRPHDKLERRERWIRPESDWVVKTGAHPPLISQELFERVQSRLALNKRQTRATVGGYPLSGLIRCAHCGKSYIGGGGPRNYRDPSDPDRYRFYKDGGSHDDNRVCEGHTGTISKRLVERLVIEEISKVVSAPGMQALIAEEIDRYLTDARDNTRASLGALKKEMSRLTGSRGNLVQAIGRGVLRDDEAAGELERIRKELERVEAEVKRLEAARSAAKEISRERDALVAMAANFARSASILTGPALRELIAPWLEDAVYDKFERTLTLVIRRVPAVPGVLLSSHSLAPTRRKQKLAPAVRRTIRLGGRSRWWPDGRRALLTSTEADAFGTEADSDVKVTRESGAGTQARSFPAGRGQ